jgi:hypothetical protein
VSQYPQEYYSYYPNQYQPAFWQALIAGIVDLIIIAAMAAWAFSLIKKSLKGEEVKLL